MTVRASAIALATKKGMHNADILAKVADELGVEYSACLALMEMESNGENIWGADKGGYFSGKKGLVTEADYKIFRNAVVTHGHTSNGVGPAQITWRGFFPDMEKKGLKPWDIHDNMKYGLTLLFSYYKASGSWTSAGKKYNGALSYGIRFAAKRLKWRTLMLTAK